jgi:hypothetical protein
VTDRIADWIICHPFLAGGAFVLASLPIGYGLALLGEPRAVWIWRDILGVLL